MSERNDSYAVTLKLVNGINYSFLSGTFSLLEDIGYISKPQRSSHKDPDFEVRDPSPIPTPSTEERQQRALQRMSADLLAERERRERPTG